MNSYCWSKTLLLILFPIALLGQVKENEDLNKLSYDGLWQLFFRNYETNTNQIKYAKAYLKKAIKENYEAQIGRGYYLLAFNYYDNNDEKAIFYLDKALVYSKKTKDIFLITTIYFDKAGILRNQLKFKEAINNFILAEKSNKNLDYSYILKLNIAIIKSENLGEVDEALILYKDCYNYYKSRGTRNPRYNSYYQEILFDLADAYKEKKLTDSSTYYNRLGYMEAKFSKDEEMLNLFILNEGANQVIKKNYKVALDSINKALPKMKLFKNIDNTLAGYYYLGKIHEGIGNNKKAVENYKKMDSIYLKSKNIVPEFLSGYHYLITYYKSKGDKANQLKYLTTFMSIDSTMQLNYKYLYKTIQANYDTPNLIKDKESLISSLKRDNKMSYLSVVCLIFLSIGMFFLATYQNKLKKTYKERFEKIIIELDNNRIPKDEGVEIASVREKAIKNIEIAPELIHQILNKLDQFEFQKRFLESNITIQILSNEFDTNVKYLSKIVNAHKDKNFIQYINDLRIEYAIMQMQKENVLRKYTLSALAKEFGFNNVESFTTAFYKKTGIKPLYFIKELKDVKK